MKRIFVVLQSLQMMQQPNRYKGRGYRVKAKRPEQGDEPAQQEAKQKAPSSAARKGFKAPSSSAQCTGKAGRSRKDTIHVARTRGQQAGKQGGNKKADITESEPSGSKLDNVDDFEDYSSH